MENATFRKWLTEQGCRFDTQRTAEMPLVGSHHELDPRSVRQVCEALGIAWSDLPGPKGRV